jgi:hypothetical protein
MLTNILWFGLGVICTCGCLFVAACLHHPAWDYNEMAAWQRKIERLERDNNAG